MNRLRLPLFRHLRSALLALAFMLCWACTSTPVRYEGVSVVGLEPTQTLQMSTATRHSIDGLASAIRQLSPKIRPSDAELIAKEAHLYPMHLANVWQISDSPLLHNLATNNGEREYGLCIDWAYAMRERLLSFGLTSFDWFWGIANEGSALREHSSLVLVAKGEPFQNGIVLDPWRHSGKLFWTRIGQDPKYDWLPYALPDGWHPRAKN